MKDIVHEELEGMFFVTVAPSRDHPRLRWRIRINGIWFPVAMDGHGEKTSTEIVYIFPMHVESVWVWSWGIQRL